MAEIILKKFKVGVVQKKKGFTKIVVAVNVICLFSEITFFFCRTIPTPGTSRSHKRQKDVRFCIEADFICTI